MSGPWILLSLLGLGGGFVADQHLNEGKATAATADTVGSAVHKAIFRESTQKTDLMGSGANLAGLDQGNMMDALTGGQNQEGGFGSFLKDNIGKMAGLGGLAALWMSPAPQILKSVMTVAVLAYVAYDFIQNKMGNDFKAAHDYERNALDHNVDLNDPNIVGQDGYGRLLPSIGKEMELNASPV